MLFCKLGTLSFADEVEMDELTMFVRLDKSFKGGLLLFDVDVGIGCLMV